ncbi:hypothetical protein Gogos_019176 [Gossypium gossypioides]|uniref:Uncharacterized protein n=1 Tax=Gossypium gossypioides TaxID=34282 RepID=A0A7J9BGK7_GOSGO|nr:hypothetical protein [Gossypium gossypioides]
MASLPPSNGQTEDKESPSKSSLTQDNSSPLVVFAHGAGAPSSFDWMIRSLLSPSSFIRLYGFLFWHYMNNQVPYFHPAFSHWRDGRETLGFFVVFSRFLSKSLSPFVCRKLFVHGDVDLGALDLCDLDADALLKAQDLHQWMALTCSMVSTAVLLDLFGSRLVGWE